MLRGKSLCMFVTAVVDRLRSGDVIVVTGLDHLARSARDLLNVLRCCQAGW
jgi:DNA invertase Pin-like site-specific DNA recombinase